MISESGATRPPPAVVAALAHRRRRVVVGTLLERDGPVPVRDLARATAAAEGDSTADDRDRHRVSLHHVHLPRLADAGLLERDREAETVSLAEHPALEATWLRDLLRGPFDGTGRDAAERRCDRRLEALAAPGRRAVLAILAERDECASVRTLAERLASCGADGGDVGEAAVDAAAVDLVHVHLPALADAGIVDYDPRHGTVAALADSPERPAWFDEGPFADLVAGNGSTEGIEPGAE